MRNRYPPVYYCETMRQTIWEGFAAVVLLLGAAAGSGAALGQAGGPEPALLRVSGLGRGTVALDGPWQFHAGDDPGWAAPGVDTAGWESVNPAMALGDQGHWAFEGFGWYRRKVEFATGPEEPDDVTLFIPALPNDYEVYWNGRLVGGLGKLPGSPATQGGNAQVVHLGAPGAGVLAVRIWAVPIDSSTAGDHSGAIGLIRAGSMEATDLLEQQSAAIPLRASILTLIEWFIYLQLAVLGLVAWLRNRDQRLLFWVEMLFLSTALYIGITSELFSFMVKIPILFSSPFHALQDVALWYTLIYLLNLNGNRFLMRVTRVLAVIGLVSAFLDDLVFNIAWSGVHPHGFHVLDGIFTAGFSVVEIFPMVLVAMALKKRLDRARWLVAGAAFLSEMYFVIFHTANQGQRYTRFELGDWMLLPIAAPLGVPIYAPSVLSLLLMASLVYAVYRYAIEQSRKQRGLVEEFKSAQELQRTLIPEALPTLPGFAVTSAYRPAAEVGGDFFQLIPLEQGATLVVIGDVSGKGLKAAMAVALIVGALRTLAETTHDPAAVLAGLNRRLVGRLGGGFVTCLALRIKPTGECMAANAGHLAPFLNGRELSMPGALPLGLVAEAHYTAGVIALRVNDRLTLYTDGLLEARNAAGELYSFDRLEALMAARPDAGQAVDAAVEFGQEDDITVLTLTRLATGVESTTQLIAPRLVRGVA